MPSVTRRDAAPSSAAELDRRAALKLLASGMALSLASCGKPPEEIVPYVDQPERLVPGIPLKFATTLDMAGYGRGVIATSVEGRPIKVEGNPRHPASLGATDVFAEASVLTLYDPDRSKAPRGPKGIASWDAFGDALRTQMEKEKKRGGAGLRLVSGRVTSPTLLRQINALLKTFPQARWYRYEPVSDDNERDGAMMAFGRPLTPLPRVGEASVVLSLDDDFFGAGPRQIVNGRAFISARKADAGADKFLRLYVAEPVLSLTGANADHWLAIRPELIRNIAITVAATLRGEKASAPLPPEAEHFAAVVAADLKSKAGKAIVMVGRAQPADVHALCHTINNMLHAPVDYIEPVDPAGKHRDALHSFADDLSNNRVETLLILDANPAYDAPRELGFKAGFPKLPFSAHLGLYDDETAAICHWHLPLSHTLESWSDLRAFDGTASIVQPLIRPLYDTRTKHQAIALLGGALSPVSYDLVRETWQPQAGGDFEGWWRQVLNDGVIGETRHVAVSAQPKAVDIKPTASPAETVLVVTPDPSIWDGRHANNAWLQECPKPLSKETWGNTLSISSHDAQQLRFETGDVVTLKYKDVSVEAVVRVNANQANGVYATTLGHGRRKAGAIGNGIGFDVYPLRGIDAPWLIDSVTIAKTGKTRDIPTTQDQFRLEGETLQLLPRVSLAALAAGLKGPPFEEGRKPTLYPPVQNDDPYAWAMVIDSSACIGCNACVIACQAENNVPVVGPDQILRSRVMHWLRVDTYTDANGGIQGFQPVPCMHCEHAPCEPVCPVAASVHDREGLNVQVYNRCIGTRFCQSNCPYKVRRFNWFGYADDEEYANLGESPIKAQHNPDVTVRARGVMEKCTYCVQRISRARREAEKENRTIKEGEVVTACQAACPTRAISFGNLKNPGARVNALRKEKQHYELLGHLGTRPRTTYLARLTNPNPDLGEAKS
ncbi:4Fe-4S dicluster domain-containing protein [Gaiella sp.]|uniref:4Fe-4S dicluster domain-containing protein n=1 Tax=Gaiella sp. TaxID=2663207 RepID=UPI002E2FC6AC|nr:4Fe-4S dicluster domain-containing protein [Gaiella sp.]HEX5585595.1 4Fe-4S dicluster domain-containing protein [Gaiella sp.]